MKGNGIEVDTLDRVIEALERVRDTWQNSWNALQYPDLRDAIIYLKEFQYQIEKARHEHLFNAIKGSSLGKEKE